MSKLEKILIFLMFIPVVIGSIVARVNPDYFGSVYVKEDGIIEWLTVLALVLGMSLCFYRSIRLWPYRNKVFILMTTLLGLLFLFGAGEEISWGQRIFNIQTTDFFYKHNTQQEMNIHNLVLGGVRINKLFFGLLLGILIALYFIVLPFLYRKWAQISKIVDYFAIPIPRNIHIILYLILAIVAYLAANPKKGELLEFGGCWIFLLMIYNPFNKRIYQPTQSTQPTQPTQPTQLTHPTPPQSN